MFGLAASPRRRFACLLGLLFSAGCGLAEYEKKAQDQQRLVEKIERADKLLGEPVDLGKPEKNAPEPMLFLRLPKDLNNHAKMQPFAGLTYYSFARAAAASSGSAANSPFAEVLLAFTQPAALGDATSQAKKEDVLQRVRERYQLQGQKGVPENVQGFLRPGSTPYEVFQLDRGNYATMIFMSETQGLVKSQVALIFNVEKAKKDEAAVKEMMRFSLETLTVGFEAESAKQDYNRTRAPGRSGLPQK